MKILVIGLDCAAPEILLEDDSLPNIRRLMAAGCYGRLESVVPPITVPAWMCMATSRDPGSLGVYGFRNRVDRSYDGLAVADSSWFREPTIWDEIAARGGRSVLLGVPPSYPPRRVNGISVGCFLTPDTATHAYTHPPEVREEIARLVGDYPVDVAGFRTDDKARLRDDIHAMTRKHFEVARHYLRTATWDYFQLVEIGLDRIQHGFWKHHDPSHVMHDPTSPYRGVVREYYRYLDHEIGTLLELLDDDTLVMVVSDHGARSLDGGFCVNEWLMREGLLTLRDPFPDTPTALDGLRVDWSRTVAWSTGGYHARIFLNVRGREPDGLIEASDYQRTREELGRRLESVPGPDGAPLGTRVFVPEEVYEKVVGVAPDLIVHFGDLAWRAVGSIGHGSIHVQENDTGPDDCNHAQYGAFVLAGPGIGYQGEIDGFRLLDVAPTLLQLAGYDVPPAMQGRVLPVGRSPAPATGAHDRGDGPGGSDLEGEAEIYERLKGLGYIS